MWLHPPNFLLLRPSPFQPALDALTAPRAAYRSFTFTDCFGWTLLVKLVWDLAFRMERKSKGQQVNKALAEKSDQGVWDSLLRMSRIAGSRGNPWSWSMGRTLNLFLSRTRFRRCSLDARLPALVNFHLVTRVSYKMWRRIGQFERRVQTTASQGPWDIPQHA